jgi:geranylgeranyl diphosphate synthase type II
MAGELNAWSEIVRRRFDAFLEPRWRDAWPTSFVAPLRYPVFGGGKRVRPLLAVAACESVGGRMDDAMPAAAAVELVHTYSLVHDDMPCMDNDDMRRGRPTVHKAFDDGTALLVGDALLTDAFAILAEADVPAETRVAWVLELSRAAGWRGMVGGQVADVKLGASIKDLETLQRVHALKTGALIRAAVLMGGMAGEATDAQRAILSEYGAKVGLAFQLADDVLDADQDDKPNGPPSYVKLLGVPETRRRARAVADEAIAAVKKLPFPKTLIELANYTVQRDV